VEVLGCCSVRDAVVINEVGHLATAVQIILLMELGSSLIRLFMQILNLIIEDWLEQAFTS
jgi:hypothetical protein